MLLINFVKANDILLQFCHIISLIEFTKSFTESNVIIADVAVRKYHQQQDDTFIFFTRTILESAKLFLSVTHAFITSVCW